MGGKRGSGGTATTASHQLSLLPDGGRVIAAEVHGFRHATSDWPALLAAVRDLGATHVTTLVPWNEVEPRAGDVELGEHRPSMAIGAFLDRIADAGLRAIVRIGPRVRADLGLAGLPDHVVHDRASMARSARGNAVPSPMPPRMFPWPSYASAAYRAHVRRFVGTVAPMLASRLAPNGVIDAIDIEDPGAVIIRAGAYARDYHPDAVASFHVFLEQRYGSIDALCGAWGIAETSFSAVTPPTRFAAGSPRDLPRHLDWAAFQEWLVDDFRAFLRDALADAGLGNAPVSSAIDASAIGVPTDASNASARLNRVGIELATRASEFVAIRRRLSSIVTSTDRPFARVLAGGSPWGRPRRDDDVIATALLSVALGAREIEVSMAVAHERWWGAPIDLDGTKTKSFASTRSLVAALASLGIEKLTAKRDVVVVIPPEYARFVRVTHLFGPLGAGLLDFAGRSFAEATLDSTFGFDRPIQHAFLDRLAALESALDAARIDFAFLDPASARTLDSIPRIAFVPTFQMLDEATSHALADLGSRGTKLVIGPDRPSLGRSMDPIDSGLRDAEVLGDLEHLAFVDRMRELVAAVGVAPAPHDPDSHARAIALHRGDARAGYVLVNAGETRGEIRLDGDDAWVDPIADESFPAGAPIPVIATSARLVVPASVGRARAAESRTKAAR